ncbi:MAG: thiamine pyrophosphate-dependent enzyme [Candidatus Bathyarchaeota archaeon]|nr:thiamine pyrophosphate-dependent enzyme [Candidatus Bathyarchaeota archaeon]MDH5532378.1 thiamine pyrophosphate-dependent enzyme [Candidatus Bathyarchaeota archaeon]MDH5713400.1 thiamine pyrophosphate-dependent enzyme [Candidatus Bathyarchaeota archaeon]
MSSEWKFTTKDLAEKPELLMPGHRACAGCGPAVVYRQILKATRGPIIATNATGCMEVVTTIYPYTAWRIPWIHTAFENVAANAAGIETALKVMKRKGHLKHDHIDVIAFAGDGGTYDIGLQALSGAVERGHDFLYVLYDNEAYMNTGIQRSGGTPHCASTTTSPAGRVIPGKPEYKKPIADIMVAHGIPYVAAASPAYWRDLITKARKGLEVKGPAFLHALAPCPRGWRYDTSKTIEIARLAVETCVFPLWEAVDGEHSLSAPSKVIALKPERKKPVREYLKNQGRFRHLFTPEFEHIIDEIEHIVDRRWKLLLKKCGMA